MIKYKNKKTRVDGILFDSAREAARYCVLKAKERSGEITELERQKKFEILPGFVYRGERVRKVVYIADFVYRNKNGEKIIEDVKGFKTKDYLLKKKLLLSRLAAEGNETIFIET